MGSCFSQPAQDQDGNQAAAPVGSSQAALARPSNTATAGSLQRQPSSTVQVNSLAELTSKPLIIKEWSSKDRTWTREQLDREREAFFDTRISGHQQVWQAIKSAFEVLWEGGDAMDNDGGLGTAQTLLTSAGVVLPRGDPHRGIYDETGISYPVPRYIINDPRNIVLEPVDGSEPLQNAPLDEESDGSESEGRTAAEALKRKEEKGKGRERDMITVTARRSDNGNDLTVQSDKTENVAILRQRFTQAAGIQQPKYIKLMNMGAELSDGKTLEVQRWNGQILHAMVVGDEKWECESD